MTSKTFNQAMALNTKCKNLNTTIMAIDKRIGTAMNCIIENGAINTSDTMDMISINHNKEQFSIMIPGIYNFQVKFMSDLKDFLKKELAETEKLFDQL